MKTYEVTADKWGRHSKGDKVELHESTAIGALNKGVIKDPEKKNNKSEKTGKKEKKNK